MDAVVTLGRTEPAGKAASLWLSYERNNQRDLYLSMDLKETGEKS